MKTREIKVARIGNSRGVRLPAAALRRYRIGDSVIMEEMTEGILLRPAGSLVEKLSWEETAREMAASCEEWNEWEATVADGTDEIPWEAAPAHRVAERKSKYAIKPNPGMRSGGKK
ncbi:MAG: AbrB/MazE/SpoVT family DNA-binding domain-containing protein [Candidatus Aminicenantales bacterium]